MPHTNNKEITPIVFQLNFLRLFYTKIGSPEELSALDFLDANNLLQKVALLT
jgi:hypothetical protein